MPHTILARQLKKLGLTRETPPSDPEPWRAFLERIGRTYLDADQDRYRLERSLTIMSDEMMELYTALKRTSESRLAAERNRLRAVLSSLGAGLLLLDPDLRIRTVNPQGARLLNVTEAQLIGHPIEAIFQADEEAHRFPDGEMLRQQLASGEDHPAGEASLIRGDGTTFTVSYILSPLLEEDALTGVVLVFVDITARKQAEAALKDAHDVLEARVRERTAELARLNEGLHAQIVERMRAEEILRQSEARFRSLVQNGSDIIVIIAPDGTLRYASPSLERILGYRPEDRIDRSVFDLLHPDEEERVRQSLHRVTQRPGLHTPTELRLRHADGSWRHFETTATNLLDDSSVRGIVQNLHDVTERKRLEEQLTHQAFWDALTGLPNRALFREQLRQAAARCNGGSHRLAVLFIDLDQFKCVNDSLGHDVGDRLLIAVAQRLRECVRGNDVVARLSGDEFTVLLEGIREVGEVLAVVERISERMQQPYSLEGHEVVVTASVGIAIGEAGRCAPETLIREADVATYAAKIQGRSRFELYRPGMDRHTIERLELEAELRRAIRENELRLFYQPLIDLKTGRLYGVEALVRWQHPRRGMVSPAVFIPAAEQSGLILPLGEWVLREACRQAHAWHTARPDRPPIEVSVNLSARQLSQPGLLQLVAGTLEETGLDPATLTLEITESAVAEDAEAAIATMTGLKDLGIGLAIDDFGTGYSSLAYLKRFPVDSLKIDRSFVDGLGHEAEDTAIVHAIVALARALGLCVTAEGVETIEQMKALIQLDCDQGQGYLFARPLPPDDLIALIESRGDSQVLLPPSLEHAFPPQMTLAARTHRRPRRQARLRRTGKRTGPINP